MISAGPLSRAVSTDRRLGSPSMFEDLRPHHGGWSGIVARSQWMSHLARRIKCRRLRQGGDQDVRLEGVQAGIPACGRRGVYRRT
jgi:hypothetical protein